MGLPLEHPSEMMSGLHVEGPMMLKVEIAADRKSVV